MEAGTKLREISRTLRVFRKVSVYYTSYGYLCNDMFHVEFIIEKMHFDFIGNPSWSMLQHYVCLIRTNGSIESASIDPGYNDNCELLNALFEEQEDDE